MQQHDLTVAFLHRLRRALDERRVQITWKADDEIASLGWSRQDAFDQLMVLEPADLLRTEPAKNQDFNLIWVFCPFAWDLEGHLWIRLTERADRTFLVSLHLAEGDPWT
ncbi:MAG: hypothetical protein ABIO70_21060 [Pseudomonadota bacterium]